MAFNIKSWGKELTAYDVVVLLCISYLQLATLFMEYYTVGSWQQHPPVYTYAQYISEDYT